MTRRTRRNHAPAFKAQVALTALKSDKTRAELAQQYDLHPNQITDWKRQLTKRAVQVFGGAGSPAGGDPDLTKLHAKIGHVNGGEKPRQSGAEKRRSAWLQARNCRAYSHAPAYPSLRRVKGLLRRAGARP